MKQIVPNLWEIDEIGDAVHCYLYEWSQGVTLIDTGMPNNATKILDAIAKRGYARHQLKRIIVTHADTDHTGSLAQIKRATGASVACHSVEKEFLEHPRRRKPKLWLQPLFAVMARLPAYYVRPCRPDELLVDGQELPEGFTVIHTPGHTPGHISLLHKKQRFVIAGDALANRNEKLQPPYNPFTPDVKNAERSVWKLAKKYGEEFDTLVFGHGPPILQNGGQRVKALVSQIFSNEV